MSDGPRGFAMPGIDDVIAMQRRTLAEATGVPASTLFGTRPRGLDDDRRAFLEEYMRSTLLVHLPREQYAAMMAPPRYRGPRCRWCRADDYRKRDGRCPRCNDHKDRGRTEYTMRPAWWTMDPWDDPMASLRARAASEYACGLLPTAIRIIVMLD